MHQKKHIFPLHGDRGFAKRIGELEEFRMYAAEEPVASKNVAEFEDAVQTACGGFEKSLYQNMVQHYLSRRTPYKSILLFHGLGVGKTCSSITVAESMLLDHTVGMPPRVLVVSPLALRRSYEDQVFSAARYLSNNPDDVKNQCTSDTYTRLVHGNPSKELFLKRVQQLIRSRYHFLTYDSLVPYVQENPHVSNTVIIVDEAHNLRNNDTDKKAADALEQMLVSGTGNRLVLLSATPMYNEPDELLWLLKLLLTNDKNPYKLPRSLYGKDGQLDETCKTMLKQLSQEYISYIRGKNPFTFATRVTPAMSGIPICQDTWSESIQDGIVLTNIGSKQKDGGVINESVSSKLGSSPKQLQWLNITYPSNSHGEKGFDRMFVRMGDPFPVVYKPAYMNWLMPTEGNLCDHAAKLDRICSLIRHSQGIIVVYSQFVWSGVVPLAIALEHMGFRRYGGADMLQKPQLVPDPVSYENIPIPQYCILSGDTNVMGASRIESLRQTINSADNVNGGRIKVILITPIAGEGLSFQNVREVHVMDPWYHINRVEQVIGRAIRTCSHTSLPLEERNVTVFLHAILGNGPKDTADIHAYKIAARKLRQTKEIEALIRDNALDCSLHYHLNYIPKSKFRFDVQMRSSQGKVFPYRYGDEESARPACAPIDTAIEGDTRSMRYDTYASLLPTVVRRMERYIMKRLDNQAYFTINDLVKGTRMKDYLVHAALAQVVHPYEWIPGYTVHIHRQGVVLSRKDGLPPLTEIALPPTDVTTLDTSLNGSDNANVCDPSAILAAIPPTTDEGIRTLMFYQVVDSHCWSRIAMHILENQNASSMKPFTSLLWKTGALIARQELPKSASAEQFIGYVDIFNKDDFVAYVVDSKGIRSCTQTEIRAISNKRDMWAKPTKDDLLYGILEPFKFSKSISAPLRVTLKLMPPGASVGKKRGVVCNSNKKKELVEWLRDLEADVDPIETDTKDQLCFTIALTLLRKKRLLMYPLWKPRVSI